MKKLITILALAAISGSALADDWHEVGDAGGLPPGQITVGNGPLDHIIGKLEGARDIGNDYEDMYCIRITDAAHFSATSVGGATFDTQLFLFSFDGHGVTFNDDSVGVQSTLTSQYVVAPGMYHLAITGYNNDPVDASGALLWNNSPFGIERQADGPGAANAIASWTGSGGTGDYIISLTGAEFCRVPAPGAMAMLGLGGLVAARRRRA